LFLGSAASGAPKDSGKTASKDVVSGLLIDVKDDGIIVQHDGEADTTKYLYGGAITKAALLKQNIFNVDRVNVKFKADGDTRTLVAIEKVPGKQSGVIIGEVIKVYNEFWVAVKPKNGMIEGFALNGPPDKVKPALDILKSLNPGDIVAIKYGTDFERHRILQIEVKPAPPSKSPGAGSKNNPPNAK
jgi:hypothetical protein